MNDAGKTLVLVVDDAAFSRRMLRKYVEAEGCQVIEAANGQQALEMVQQHQPDCILTDLLMPDIDGFQLLQALREQDQMIPIAIISADIQDTSHQRGIELGATSFINKPAKEDQVRQTIRQLLQREGANP
ncbi:response regulator [Leptolyngbya sp. AN03gr2]|uniref:response regulator n=1 Tax=unclassified Leptolyngbya TaxID=2650499 RepID=UPI003D318DC0